MRVLLLTGLLACSSGGVEDSSSATTEPAALEPTSETAPLVPSVLHVRWTAEGTSRVEWGTDPETLDQQTPEVAGPDVALALLGLPTGETIHWRAVSEDGEQTRVSEVRAFDVPQPTRLPPLEVTVHQADAVMPRGYLLGAVTTWLNGNGPIKTTVGIWRASDGTPVWWRDLDDGQVSVSPAWSDHDAAVRFDAYDLGNDGAATGHLVQLDGSTEIVDPLYTGHHNAIETTEGRWAWLGSDLLQGTGRVDLVDKVYTAPVGDTASPTLLFDEYTEVFGGAPPETCVHNNQPTTSVFGDVAYDWAHTNSITWSDSGALYVYGRYIDALWKLDGVTGEEQWQLGGPGSDFTAPDGSSLWEGPEASQLWSHAHMTDVWDGGALVFDNGDHYTPPQSTVVEIAWDEDAKTAWEVRRFAHPEGAYMFILGDARRLPDEHVLASWTRMGEVTEFAPDGSVVWSAQAPPGLDVSRVRFVEDLYAVGAP